MTFPSFNGKIMPIYEFKCSRCRETFEKLQKYDDKSPACPACGYEYSERLISACNHELKGTGWYKTDFKNK